MPLRPARRESEKRTKDELPLRLRAAASVAAAARSGASPDSVRHLRATAIAKEGVHSLLFLLRYPWRVRAAGAE